MIFDSEIVFHGKLGRNNYLAHGESWRLQVVSTTGAKTGSVGCWFLSLESLTGKTMVGLTGMFQSRRSNR